MPSKSRTPRKSAADRKAEAEAAKFAAAVAARPFSPEHSADSPEAFANLPEPIRSAVAESIFRDYAVLGFSADDCRAKYGGERDGGKSGGLTGKRRREVLRAYGFGSGVARSYSAYSDGAPRSGSSHARTHGPLAQERAAALAAEAEAEAEAAAQVAAEAYRVQGETLREAGKRVPRDAAKREAAFLGLAR